MGTVVKDEASILKALEKKPKGIRSTELFHTVRRTVRSLTTFQKRLKHLEQKGRLEIGPDLDDMRATVVKPTETSAEAGHILEAIETLEKLYLTKLPRKVVRVREPRSDPMENEMREVGSGAANLLLIAHETFLRSKGGQFGDPHVWLRVEEGPGENEVAIRWLTLTEWNKLVQNLEELKKRFESEKQALDKLNKAL